MTEGEILRMIQLAVRQELAPILMGTQTDSESSARVSLRRFATDGVQDGLRNILPYGFASRAPDGMDCLSIPIAADSSNKSIVGHFDPNRPALEKGEVAFYGPGGQLIIFKLDGTILQSTSGATATEPIVLGNILKEFLTNVLNAFLNASQIGIDSLGGPVQLAPALRQMLTEYKSTYLDTDATNILSTKNFVERS